LCAHAQDTGGEEWVKAATRRSVTIYNRSRSGSKVKELKAIGVIKAAPAAVFKVINDIEGYRRFMPYTGEARVISRDTNSMVVYQRLAMPMVSDRDFAIRIYNETRHSPDGITNFVSRWQAANEFAPPEKSGVVRVKTNEGSWTLQPVEDGRFTRVTYSVYTDPGGKIPVSILNTANTKAIPKVFDAVQKEASRADKEKVEQRSGSKSSASP
jgi:ribosome-associated toxin RatA of RatAB toxin-antitoxin module